MPECVLHDINAIRQIGKRIKLLTRMVWDSRSSDHCKFSNESVLRLSGNTDSHASNVLFDHLGRLQCQLRVGGPDLEDDYNQVSV